MDSPVSYTVLPVGDPGLAIMLGLICQAAGCRTVETSSDDELDLYVFGPERVLQGLTVVLANVTLQATPAPASISWAIGYGQAVLGQLFLLIGGLPRATDDELDAAVGEVFGATDPQEDEAIESEDWRHGYRDGLRADIGDRAITS